MATSKYELFWEANAAAGDVVDEVREAFGKWGAFHIDNADAIVWASKLEVIAPELIAVTWMNESTFRFYTEPNMNGRPDDFDKWDVGPMQLNVGYTQRDLTVGFFKAIEVDLPRVFGNSAGTVLFNGDPLENLKLGARKLKALGRAEVIGKNKKVLMPKVSVVDWVGWDENDKNRRRAALYTRPDARDARIASYNKFAPMFATFFKHYMAR